MMLISFKYRMKSNNFGKLAFRAEYFKNQQLKYAWIFSKQIMNLT